MLLFVGPRGVASRALSKSSPPLCRKAIRNAGNPLLGQDETWDYLDHLFSKAIAVQFDFFGECFFNDLSL
jgi:hypothetical protein